VKTNELDLHNKEVVKLKKYAAIGSAGAGSEFEFLYEDYRYDEDTSIILDTPKYM
jgi:hypothetical protein